MYPALSVLKALDKDVAEMLWVGGEGGMEADLVKPTGVPYAAVPAAGVHGVGLRTLPANLLRLSRGTFASRRILKQFRPNVLLFTGGYVAVPMALAAGRSVPSLLYVPDIEPGLALKTLARFASTIALTVSDSRAYFDGSHARLEVTGYPTRPDLSGWQRGAGRAHLGLPDDERVLLVTGGSKGALTLNRSVLAVLPQLLELGHVLHLAGQANLAEAEAAAQGLPPALAERYHLRPYLHEMGAALAAADLVVSRAGASSLGEYPLFGLPAILVPYPYAWRYQKVNADYLVAQGAGLLIENDQLAEKLLPAVQDLFNHPDRLESMKTRMRSLAQPQAAGRIADLVRQTARVSATNGGNP